LVVSLLIDFVVAIRFGHCLFLQYFFDRAV
jgi:hypothetical protein